MPSVLWPDLEAWLVDYVRDVVLVDAGLEAEISNKEPADDPFPAALVVLRDDGGPKTSMITAQRSVGVTILAGTQRLDAPAKDLSRPILGALTDEDLPLLGGPSCPIASVDDFNGPYTVPEEQDRTRLYFTVTYTVVGSPAG